MLFTSIRKGPRRAREVSQRERQTLRTEFDTDQLRIFCMTSAQEKIARSCLLAAENGTMSFPEIVQTLMQASFESYMIDFRRRRATYYLPNGESVEHPTQE